VPHGTSVHGEYWFPDMYRLVFVPPFVPLEFADPPGHASVLARQESASSDNILERLISFVQAIWTQAIQARSGQTELELEEGQNPREHSSNIVHQELASSYNVPKLLISFAQAIWATITIYRARGDQIDQYGYAAFGLTVAPYAFMSVVNIIANLMTPEYSTLFLVRTPVMRDAEQDGAFFRGEIRVKTPDADNSSYDGIFDGLDGAPKLSLLGNAIGLVPLAIVGALSRFQAESSTSIQRGFTMSWLVVGIIFGPMVERMYSEGFLEPINSKSLLVLADDILGVSCVVSQFFPYSYLESVRLVEW
jgi:hypothetical protein